MQARDSFAIELGDGWTPEKRSEAHKQLSSPLVS